MNQENGATKKDDTECPKCDGLRWVWEYGIDEQWPVQCPRCNWDCRCGEPYDLQTKAKTMTEKHTENSGGPSDGDLWDMWQAVMEDDEYRNADERTRAIAYARTVLSARWTEL